MRAIWNKIWVVWEGVEDEKWGRILEIGKYLLSIWPNGWNKSWKSKKCRQIDQSRQARDLCICASYVYKFQTSFNMSIGYKRTGQNHVHILYVVVRRPYINELFKQFYFPYSNSYSDPRAAIKNLNIHRNELEIVFWFPRKISWNILIASLDTIQIPSCILFNSSCISYLGNQIRPG